MFALSLGEVGLDVPSGTLELTPLCESPACCWCSWLVLLGHLGRKCCPQPCPAKVRKQKNSSGTVLASQILYSYFIQSRILLQLFKSVLIGDLDGSVVFMV